MDFAGCFNDNTFLNSRRFYYHHAVFNHLVWTSSLCIKREELPKAYY